MMKIKVLFLILCISFGQIACVTSAKYKECNKKIAALEDINSKLLVKETQTKVDLSKIKELETQLDKTERVLAKIYLQYANLTPKKIESTNQSLSSQIAEESLNLKLENQTLVRQIDSLKSITLSSKPTNLPSVETNTTPSKLSKKQKPDLQKNYEAQSQYLQQIESNYNKSLQTISQLNKSLNGYSLKLEIMDNEKNKAIGEIQETLKHKNQEIDSLRKKLEITSPKPQDISENTTTEKDSKKIQKLKDQLNLITIELEASKDNLRNLVKEKEQNELEQNKLNKNLASNDQKINLLNSEKTEIQNKLTASQDQIKQLINNIELKNQETISWKEKISSNENKINQLIEKNRALEKEIQIKTKEFLDLKENQNFISKEEFLIVKNENEKLSNELKNYKASNAEDQKMQFSEKHKELTNKITEQNEIINKQNQQILDLSKKASKNNSALRMSEFQDSLSVKNSEINKLESQLKVQKTNADKENAEFSTRLSSLELKLTETLDKNKELARINDELIKKQNNSISKIDNETHLQADSNRKKPEMTNDKPVVPNKATNSIEKRKTNVNTTEASIKKLQKLISDFSIPGASVTNDNQAINIAIPQSSLFLVETAALTMDGVALLQKINSILQPIKAKQIDIIAYTDLNKNSDEFNLIRSKTIGKLLIAFGIPVNSINYGSRQYQVGTDVNGFSEGIEILVKVD